MKFLIAFTITKSSKLFNLPSKEVIKKAFELSPHKAGIVLYYMIKFLECFRNEGISANKDMLHNNKIIKTLTNITCA